MATPTEDYFAGNLHAMGGFGMTPTELSQKYIRVEYDDSHPLPWKIVWDEETIWGWCTDREEADLLVRELQIIAAAFHVWAKRQ